MICSFQTLPDYLQMKNKGIIFEWSWTAVQIQMKPNFYDLIDDYQIKPSMKNWVKSQQQSQIWII